MRTSSSVKRPEKMELNLSGGHRGLGGIGARLDCGANAWRSSLKTLLLENLRDEPLGLLS
jgi:hypothetical protein